MGRSSGRVAPPREEEISNEKYYI
jgi:hypothetical protein